MITNPMQEGRSGDPAPGIHAGASDGGSEGREFEARGPAPSLFDPEQLVDLQDL